MNSLLYPLFVSGWRRLGSPGSRTDRIRNWFFGSFGFVILYLIYVVARWSLKKITENPQLSQLPPAEFFSLILSFLFVMLIVSGIFGAIGILFSAQDLDLLRKAPLSWKRFFANRFLLVTIVPSWMPAIFLIPLFIAFQVEYHGPWWFWIAGSVVLIPYYVMASAFSCCASQLLLLVLPWRRARELAFAAFILLLVGGVKLFSDLNLGMSSSENSKEILRILSLLTITEVRWLPSTWCGELLEMLLRLRIDGRTLDLSLLLTSAAAGLYLWTFVVFKIWYDKTYGSGNSGSSSSFSIVPNVALLIERLPMSPSSKALLVKEWHTVTRDIGQMLQLILLLGVTSLYLSHLRAFTVVQAFPGMVQGWWTNFLFVANVSMAAFLATALCVRFVYPSISMEGRTIWILETGPVSFQRLLSLKRIFYSVPLGLLVMTFFIMGARALDVSFEITLLSAVCACTLCYALVSLALGLGAYFARFDWEHQAELAGSFGGLVFMFLSIGLIFISMAPIWSLMIPTEDGSSSMLRLVLLGTSFIAVCFSHLIIARKAFTLGTNRLLSRNR